MIVLPDDALRDREVEPPARCAFDELMYANGQKSETGGSLRLGGRIARDLTEFRVALETTVRKRSRKSLPKRIQVRVFNRDHWLCRWCKRPVIFHPAMKYLQLHLHTAGYKDLAYWRYAYDRHGAPLLDDLAAVLDHVKAFSTGGPCDEENLVTACNKCNTRKNNSNAAEWERNHPVRAVKGKYGEPVGWDGFSSLFLFLADEYASSLTESEKAWVKALKSETQSATQSVARA